MALDQTGGRYPRLGAVIRNTGLVLASRATGLLVLLVATAFQPSTSRGREKHHEPRELQLGYEAFDQQPRSGWRKIAGEGRYQEAAALIDRYLLQNRALKEWQRVNLQFHAAQLYALANQNEPALTRLRMALLKEEPADSPIRWNVYVRATMAFLEQDRKKLAELREEIAQGPKFRNVTPNLDIVDRLLECFGQPYSVAYRGNSGECKGRTGTSIHPQPTGSSPTSVSQ